MTTIVIVPYRPDGGHRDRLWNYLQQHYWQPLGYQVVVGQHRHGVFNRSAALNDAADCDWDYAIIADSDTWVPPRQLHRALLTARITQRLTAAFDAVVELTQPCTNNILAGQSHLDDTVTCVRVRRRDLETQSSMLVVPRPLWDAIGGFDERFEGWGGEDNAFWRAAHILGGQPHRVSGNAYHLWHMPAADKHGPGYAANLALWRRYESAHTEQELRHC